MSLLEEIKIDLTGVADILRNNNLSVPKYQRSYAWKDQNVLDLFQDISTAMVGGSKEYFLGSIVISQKNNERPEVVDGQQRLATITILISAIRDYFFLNKDDKRSASIETDYLVKTELETLERIPRLHLNEADHDFFSKRVLTQPDQKERQTLPAKESHKRIDNAAKIAAEHINKLADVVNEPAKRLIEVVKYVEKNVKVISVRVPDDANAFTIFETLNDRGLPLAISDLLKNYLFHLSGNRLDEVQQRWVSMIGALEAVDSEDMVVTYIRQFWSSQYGLTRERELYKKIKERTTSKQQAIDLASDLNNNSRLYAAILNIRHDVWNDYGATAKEHMATLNDLGMIQIRPLLLAILDKFSVAEVRKSLRLFLSWSVRFLIYGGLGGGALETQYCDRAVEIRKGKIKTARELLAVMKNVVPSDGEFKQAFQNASVSKDYLARYYLRVLENQVIGKTEPELVPNSNEDVVTLEHILPENPSRAWGHVKEEDAKTYYKRIGNLALLTRKINSEIGNKGFNAKIRYYKESSFELTKNLASHVNWGISDIEARQATLAKLAVKAWPNKV
ncbi:MAG: DUF262 domain-containing protein [Nitrospiraceae bacterium]|nr:MAG: DUF262 domain-containing protein [Nitrospiraceae bacterium]